MKTRYLPVTRPLSPFPGEPLLSQPPVSCPAFTCRLRVLGFRVMGCRVMGFRLLHPRQCRSYQGDAAVARATRAYRFVDAALTRATQLIASQSSRCLTLANAAVAGPNAAITLPPDLPCLERPAAVPPAAPWRSP